MREDKGQSQPLEHPLQPTSLFLNSEMFQGWKDGSVVKYLLSKHKDLVRAPE